MKTFIFLGLALMLSACATNLQNSKSSEASTTRKPSSNDKSYQCYFDDRFFQKSEEVVRNVNGTHFINGKEVDSVKHNLSFIYDSRLTNGPYDVLVVKKDNEPFRFCSLIESSSN